MAYKRELTEILKRWIDGMCFPVNILINTVEGENTYRLRVNDVYHAQPGFSVCIADKQYQIKEVCAECGNMSLLVCGDTPITAKCFDMYRAQFFHGTAVSMNEEKIKDIETPAKVFPMIWLWDPATDKDHRDPYDTIERDSTCRLFFLTKANFDNNKTDKLYEKYEGPMSRLYQNFMKVLNDPFSGVDKWEETQVATPYAKLGIYNTKGVDKNLFSAECSGVGVAITISLYRGEDEPDTHLPFLQTQKGRFIEIE